MSTRLQIRDIFNQDLDKFFSYTTPMLVLIKDRSLGLLKMLINLIILLYFVVYVIVMEKAYLQEEYSIGTAIVYATGTAISLDGNDVRVWDSVDVAFPQYDPNAVVLNTRVFEQIRQTKGVCIDKGSPCQGNLDCLKTGVCTNGYCNEPSWCSNYQEKVIELEGIENFVIWFQGNVNFITMAPGVEFTTLDKKKSKIYPKGGANSYLLADILKIGNIDYNVIKENGGVVRVKLEWNCDITFTNDCTPSVTSERLDAISGNTLGFHYDRYFYYKENSIQYRDHQNITGIKIIVESSGKAYAITIGSIIINVSSAINLTMLTPKIVDFLMLYILANRKEYRKLKFVITKDLNEETIPERTAKQNDVQEETKERRDDEDLDETNHFRNLP